MNKTQKPLKIAQITNLWESVPPKSKGGLEQMVYYLTEGLVQQGHKVTLFCTGDSQTSAHQEVVWPKAVSHDPASQTRKRDWFSDLAVSTAFLQSEKFDIIHDHTYFVGARWAGLIDTPVIVTMHHPVDFEVDLLYEFPPKYHPYILRNKNLQYQYVQTVTVSQFQQEQLREKFQRSARTIHNGIPTSNWNHFNPTPQGYLAYLGYISGLKGVKQAIQAVKKTNMPLKIAGGFDKDDQPSVDFFENEVSPHLDGKQIEYLGYLPYEEKKEFLRNAKATLMPVQWDEPFGLVAVESLAVGTPVIAWNRGALPEIIIDGETGFLVESVEEITAKIAEIDKINRTACRRRYEENFTAEKMVKEYEKLYYKLINRQVATKPSQ